MVSKSDILSVYRLGVSGRTHEEIVFIVGHGITAVTGDWGNWIFNMEFHPKKDGYSEDNYWLEKLRRNSCQEPTVFSSRYCEEEIQEIFDAIDSGQAMATPDDIEFLVGLQASVNSEDSYRNYIFWNKESMWSNSFIDLPTGRKVRQHLLTVFDMFDEMCDRIEKLDEPYDEFKENPDHEPSA